MTVCIAAICTWNGREMIVGAADRLVTYGDVEYEQTTPKIFVLASHTVCLVSVNPAIHAAVLVDKVRARAVAMPAGVTVDALASMYANEWGLLRRERAVAKHLTPRGLNLFNYLTAQTNLQPSIAADLTELMDGPESDLGGSVIIAGIDRGLAHIYRVVDPGVASCDDIASWAVIGYGNRHADQQFISERYDFKWPFEEALLLTYLAKKRADITPGVGPFTDLFWIERGQSPNPIRLIEQNNPLMLHIRKVHQRIERSDQAIRRRSRADITAFVRSSLDQQTKAAQATQTASPDELTPPAADGSADSEGVSGDVETGESAC